MKIKPDLTITVNMYGDSDLFVQMTVGGLTVREVMRYIDCIKVALLRDGLFEDSGEFNGSYIEATVRKEDLYTNVTINDDGLNITV